ncbi:hypothetical protein DAMA08_039470 [Martiniozyma asiatica (nom. inval.)]|nr:hypothetical protein DAMA08_039470 [Martiniozyma asiatica]
MSSFLSSNSSLAALGESSRDLLGKIDNYVLDYNIFLYKGIVNAHNTDNAKLHGTLSILFDAIPDEYKGTLFNPIDGQKVGLTTTAILQMRMLELLIHERHRRDIDVLNKQLDGKIKYYPLEKTDKYEIKSPFYLTFIKSSGEYANQFQRLALLQSLEYDFEHELDDDNELQSDDDLVNLFCTDAVLDFDMKDLKDVQDVVNSQIAQLFIPLAAKSILMQDDEDDSSNHDENENEKGIEVHKEEKS